MSNNKGKKNGTLWRLWYLHCWIWSSLSLGWKMCGKR